MVVRQGAGTAVDGEFSPYYGFLKIFHEMNRTFFSSNLTLLSHASPYDVTYKGVTSCALARLASMVASIVPHRFSHAKAMGTTHAKVMSYVVAQHRLVRIKGY
jgi:hypothetical protein